MERRAAGASAPAVDAPGALVGPPADGVREVEVDGCLTLY
jgi:hypothetical protein